MLPAARSIAVRLALLLLVVIPALPAGAAEQVRVRGWSNETYGRIIFDWPKRVRYDARIDGARLVVQFERAMEGDLNRVLKYLGGYVAGTELSEDGRTATFELAGLFDLDTFVSGSSVVVDLHRARAAAPPPRNTGTAPLRVRVGHHPGFTRLVFDWLDPVGYSVARDGRNARIRFEQAATIDVASLDEALPRPGFDTPTARLEGGDLVVDLVVPEQSYIRHFRDDAKVVFDVLEEGGDFGGMIATEYSAEGALPPPGDGPMIRTISPTGEVVAVPAMVGTTVAVVPEDSRIPLVTEEGAEAATASAAGGSADGAAANGAAANGRAVPIQGSYTPLTHYDPTATGLPRDLLLYDRTFGPRSGAPAAAPIGPVTPAVPDS